MPISHPQPEKQPDLTIAPGDPLIQLHRVHFHYPDGHHALRDIDLTITAGEKVALVGPNGAGKSTLLLHLNGLLQATAGEIEVAGLPMQKKHLPRIRAHVGMVFQNPDDQLFSPTVFDDVAFGPLHMGLPPAEVKERVATALAQVGMEDIAERPPYHLSIGQKKRVAIATALAMSPQVLALDEPSASLDPRGRRQLMDLLAQLPQTMLVSTHDMRLAEALFPRLVIMDGGRIVADGETAVLLADEELLEKHGLERP